MKLGDYCLEGRFSGVAASTFRALVRHWAWLVLGVVLGITTQAQDFQITTLTASNAVVVEVNGIVGDDRGGIAVSGSQAFLTGDGDTARFNRDTLGSSAGLGVVRDSLVANLRTSTVYLLGNGSTPLGSGGGTLSSLIQLDSATGATTTNVLTLSTNISLTGSSSSVGIFSGWDRIVVHNGSRVYRISLPSGTVTDLGAMGVPQRTSSESWAYWGVAENVGSDTYIVCVRNSTTIERTKVPSGPTTTVATFSNLSDMASFTVAPALGRWYFHHESSSQFGSFSESLGYATATFVTPPSAPEITVQPTAQAVIETEPVSFTVSANGTAPLAYQWRKDGSAISAATNNIYSISSVVVADAGNYSVVITNSAGSVTSSVVALTVSVLDAEQFKLLNLRTNNFVITDPLNYAGDDRGGLVATSQKVYLRGDDSVGSVNFDLSGGTRVGTNTGGGGFNAYAYDSMVSDLRSQKAYVLANGTNILGVDGGTANTLIEIHATNGVPTGTNITLSSSIVLPSSGLYSARVGIFSGWGRIVLHNDTNAYVINPTSGAVTNLGAMTRPTRQASESWAYWGVAEYWGGNHYVVYARDAQTIVRAKIPDGTTTVISTFNNLNDLASFTVVPHLSRWYFHDETINQFTNYANYGAEILGYADATLLFQAATITAQPQSLTVTVGSNATLSVTATPVTPAFTLTYQWKKDGTNISGATNATLVFSSAQLGDSGSYTVVIGGGGSPVESASATLSVLPNAAPVFTVPGTVTINEDAGAQTNYVTAVGPGATHEIGQVLTVTASSSATNLTGALTVSYASGTASIRYTPVADAFGSATITVIVSDNGGTASGGVDATTNSYVVNVTSVNDPPSATLLTNNVVVLEDSGAYSAAILSSVSAGPANEGQTVTVTTTNNNVALFATNPAISVAGLLTFTPATNANGSATVTYVLSDGVANVTNTFTLTVTAVNDAPVANAQSVTNLEDVAFGITLTGSDVEGSSLTFTVVTGPTNGVLTGTAPNLTYTPATNFFGADSFTFKVNDGTVDSASATVSLTITAVNDAPLFTKGADQTVLEDSGAATVTGWATGISVGPTNELGQVLTFIVGNNNAALFSAQPAIATNGTLTFTPAANAFGTATVSVTLNDDGGTANSGVDTSATQTFVITVTGVNDSPAVTLLTNNVVVLEDSGGNTVSNFAAYVTGPANESGQAITNVTILSVTNSSLFSAGPALGTDGTLTFTPTANANGTALVTFTVTDNGGTANSGADTSASVAFLITVTGVNDAPSIAFTTNNYVVLEDSGGATVSGFAVFTLGPANESGQAVTNVTTSNDNAALFSVAPGFGTNGTLTFTPTANAYGSALVTVIAQDDGGTANSGVNLTTNTFTITVTPVNDLPTVTLLTNNVAVLEDSGGNTVSNFAAYVTGPANESGQAVTNVTILSVTNSGLFSAGPALGTDGTLTFTPTANANGTALVTFTVTDDGGTANGGVDTSASVAFLITVTGVNDAPTVTLLTNNVVVLEDSGLNTVSNFAAYVTGPANESGQAITNVTIVSVTNSGLFSSGPALGTDGTLTFTPTANANGTALVTFTVTDDGGTANSGVATSASVAFLITVTGVNDAPTVTLPTNSVVVLEDSGLNTVSNFAAYVTGPANESGQTITNVTIVSVTNSGLFSSGPVLGTDGTLTFTPAVNVNGTALVTFTATDNGGTANSGVDTSANVSFLITVTPVNDAPTIAFTTNNYVVLEDSGGASVGGFAILTLGPADEASQTITNVIASNDNAALFSVAPEIGTNGTLTFTPAAHAYGSALVTVIAQDDGGTANGGVSLATNTFTITVTGVNDAPSIAFATNNYVVLEDSGGSSISAFAVFTLGPANESSQIVTNVTTSNDNAALFSVAPGFGTNGTLTFTPTANAYGSALVTVIAQDDGGTANSGINLTTNTFTITVTPVNDAPTVTLLTNNVVVLEESGGNTVSNFAAYVTGPANESGQTITNVTILSVTNSSLFSAGPALGTDGMLTFTPTANANGTALVTFTVTDDGGTANSGVDTSASIAFLITVTGVNDAPTVTLFTNNLVVLEDSGGNTVSNFAVYVTGPANESGQAITNVTILSVTNSSLFSAGPALGTDGTLTFTPAVNVNGTALVTFTVTDDGGTSDGGVDTSANIAFLITVTGVNDAPAITFLTNNLLVLEDAGAQAVTNFAAFFRPADEAGQLLTNLVVFNNSSNLFSVQPAVDTNGLLTFTTAADAYGSALVTVIVQDDGGTANGGVDLATNTFTITVTAVNDAPAVLFGTNNVVVSANSGVFSGSSFANYSTGPVNESGQSITNISVGNNNGALFSAAPAIDTNGTLTFTPATNTSGSALVTVVIQDDGGTENGGVDLATNSFTITVNSVAYPPTVALTNPAPNAIFTAPASIPLAASASDSDGSIARVEFLSGTNLLASVTNAPYQFAFTNVSPGVYVFSAVATDDQSLSATSALVSVLVNYPVSLITNLALNQAATQSSTTSGGFAEKANDGNTNGAFGGSSVSHTEHAFQSWWQVDLGGVYGLAEIEVFNRTDCCGERLSNFHVLVSDDPFSADDLTTITNQAGVFSYYFSGTAGAGESFSINRTGRYVRIQLAGNGWMSLAEVLVWGSVSTQAWVHLSAPQDGTEIEATSLSLTAEAFFAASPVARVDFFTNSVLVGSVSNAPFTLEWTNFTSGSYTLTAQAVDTNGLSIVTQPVDVTILVPNQPPVVNAGTDQVAFFPVTTNANAIIRPPGRIFISNDEWPLSNQGYTNAPVGADRFARQLAGWFTGGQPGNFLAASSGLAFGGSQLAATMAAAGHTWTVDPGASFTLTNLLNYDAVFVSGSTADNQVLIDYVNAGGNVYVAAGTTGSDGIIWNEFLNYFGLNYSTMLNGLVATVPLSSTHPVLAGVPSLYFNNGNLLNELNAANPNTDTIYDTNSLALFGSYENTFNPIVLRGTVSDDGLPSGSSITQSWSKVSGPGQVFFSQSNVLTNRVVFSEAGTYVLRLTATDGTLTNSDDVEIIVNPNQAPLVEAGQPITLRLPNDATLNGSLFDDNQPDGEPLTAVWSVVSGPGNVTFGDATVTNTTATFTNIGLYTLRLTANDTQLIGTDDVLVIVLPPQNFAPTANAGADLAVVQTNSVTLAGSGSDDGLPAGSSLAGTWSKVSGPGQVVFPGSTNTATGLTNTASFTAAGTYILRLTISDGELSASDDLRVTVYSESTTNQAPVVNAGADQSFRLPDDTVYLTGTVGDDGFPISSTLSNLWTLVSGPASVTFSNAASLSATATFTQSGLYVLRLTVGDTDLSASDDVNIRVYEPITGPPPTVLITSPDDGTNVTAPTAIRGDVSAADWVLAYAFGGEDEPNRTWTTLGTGTGPVTNGVLGTLDSTLLLNGVYSVRLTATDSSGQITEDEITVLVDRNLKVGNFHFSFNDLIIPVPGMPITITRTYDSRNKQAGDFGVGWTMDLQNIRLQKNRNLGRVWTQTSSGGPFPTYSLQPNKPRLVTITFPTGKVYKFAVVPNPANSFALPIDYPFATFLPYPDTQGTLTPLYLHHVSGERIVDDSLIFPTPIPGTSDLISFELLIDPPPGPADNIYWNPDLFEFKSLEGYTYLLSATNGLRQMRDPSGNTLLITPDGVTWTNAASGSNTLSVTFQRDAAGRITNIVDAAGKAMRYAYDSEGNLASVLDQVGNTNSFTYDGQHNLLTLTDPRGIQTLDNGYDADGRLIRTTDAATNSTRYAHDLISREQYITNRLGYVTLQAFDERGNVIRKVDALGLETLYAYDANDNLVAITNAQCCSHTKVFTYDAADNLISETDTEGRVTTYTYSTIGKLLTVTDPDGSTTTNTYDLPGRLLSTRDAEGNVSSFTYNDLGLPATLMDPRGGITSFYYDGLGRLTNETDAAGYATTYTVDVNGRMLTRTRTLDPTGPPRTTLAFNDGVRTGRNRQTSTRSGGRLMAQEIIINLPPTNRSVSFTYTYDDRGRLISALFPDYSFVNTYNQVGGAQPTSTVDALGRTTSRELNPLGQPIRITYPNGTQELMTYDAEGQLTQFTDRAGRVTQFAYDPRGAITNVIYPDGRQSSAQLDLLGRLISETAGCSGTLTYTYDAMDNRTSVTDVLTNLQQFAYNSRRACTNFTDARGHQYGMEYDGLNRNTRILYPDGTTRSATWLGRLVTSMTDQSGTTTTNLYDELGRIKSTTDGAGQTSQFVHDGGGRLTQFTDTEGKVSNFAYDLMGRRVRTELPDGSVVSSQHDPAGRLIAQSDAAGNKSYFAYDVADNLIAMTNALGEVTQFTYNAARQRTSMTEANGQVTTWTYDTAGRLGRVDYPDGCYSEIHYDSCSRIASTRDRRGGLTTYAYDVLDRVAAITDPQGRVTGFSYDPVGNVAQVTDPNGQVTSYTYDQLNRLLSSTYPDGGVMTMYYDANGRMRRRVDQLGRTADYAYDANSRLTGMTNALGQVTRLTYDSRGRVASTIDALGQSTAFTYDAAGRRNSITMPDGSRRTNTFDVRGLVATETDPLGRTTAYGYDALGRVSSVTNALGYVTQFTYDVLGRLSAQIDANNRTNAFTYGHDGQLKERIFADGTRETHEYDVLCRRISTTDPRGNLTRFGYDVVGRLTSVTNALSEVTAYGYDALGRLATVTNALGRVTALQYDPLGRLTNTVNPDGTSARQVFDLRGRRTYAEDEAGVGVWFGYDALDRLTSVTNALGHVTAYGYDALGRMLSLTNANGGVTAYEYDPLGRRTKRTLPGAQFETYAYDLAGNLTNRTDFNGRVCRYEYDLLDRPVLKVPDAFFGTTNVTWGYDAVGVRTNMTDPAGTTRYAYDSRYRLIEKARTWTASGASATLTYGYDEAGNVTNTVSSLTNGTRLAYTYDALNRLASVRDAVLGTNDYGYDAAGNLAGFTRPNGLSTAYAYDQLDRATNVATHNGLTNLAQFDYTYGASGHRQSAAESLYVGAQLTTMGRSFGYDPLYRLTNETLTLDGGTAQALVYGYDPVGNRLNRAVSAGLSIASTTNTFDANDRLAADGYDANGNTLTGQLPDPFTGTVRGVTDTYDFADRLIARVAAFNGTTGTVAFAYDGDGRRVGKTVGSLTTHYLVDDVSPTGWPQVLEEHTFTTGGTPAVTQAYTYGHAPLAQRRWAGTNWQSHHYGHDAHGSVRHLSDGTGQVTDALHYEAFGQLVGRVGSTPAGRAYSGEEFDGDLGFYHLRARYHNPDSGRFWTADSFEGFAGTPQSHHAYGYVENNPVNYTDPSGHFTMAETAQVTGMVPMVRSMVMAVADGQNYYVHGLAGGSALKANGRVEADMIQGMSQHVGVNLGKENFWHTTKGAPFLLANNPFVTFQGRQCARPECRTFDPDAPIYGPYSLEPVFHPDYEGTPGYQALLDLIEPVQLARDLAGAVGANYGGDFSHLEVHSQTFQGLEAGASVIDPAQLRRNIAIGTVRAEAALLTGGLFEGGVALAEGDYEKAREIFGGIATGGLWARNLQFLNSGEMSEAGTVTRANNARRRMQSGKGALAVQRTAATKAAQAAQGLPTKIMSPTACDKLATRAAVESPTQSYLPYRRGVNYSLETFENFVGVAPSPDLPVGGGHLRSPKTIKFSQNDFLPKFDDDGRTLTETTAMLKSNPASAANIEEIQLIKFKDLPTNIQARLLAQGGSVSDVYALTGNRRLAAARRAGSQINARFATAEEIDKVNLERRFSTENAGRGIPPTR